MSSKETNGRCSAPLRAEVETHVSAQEKDGSGKFSLGIQQGLESGIVAASQGPLAVDCWLISMGLVRKCVEYTPPSSIPRTGVDLMVHTYNPSAWEAETGGSPGL